MTIFERFGDAFNRRDVDAMLECFTPDATYDDMFYGVSAGRSDLRALFERMMRESVDVLWKADHVVATPEREVAEWSFRLVISDAVPRSAGRTLSFQGVSVLELRDGRCAAYREYFDRGRALVQLGLEPGALHRVLSR